MQEAKNLYNKGKELEKQGKYSEALKWYCFYNKC